MRASFGDRQAGVREESYEELSENVITVCDWLLALSNRDRVRREGLKSQPLHQFSVLLEFVT